MDNIVLSWGSLSLSGKCSQMSPHIPIRRTGSHMQPSRTDGWDYSRFATWAGMTLRSSPYSSLWEVMELNGKCLLLFINMPHIGKW
jgi:hypothetical protein